MSKITIAELDINEAALVKSAQKSKAAIDSLVATQKKLKSQGETNSAQYVKNEAVLKGLRSEYTKQKNAINALQSDYSKMSVSLNIARTRAKDLAAEFGINSKQAKAARVQVVKLDTELKKIDNSVGQNQRSVGKYSNALKGISASFLGWTAVIYGAIRALKDMFSRVVAFDKEMTGLAAILNVTKDEVKDLELAIIDVAGSSIKTSTEVAELATKLITLGKTKEEVIKLLEPVNNLSIALEATSEDAGELLVGTLNAFGQGSESAQDYADIIAKMRTSTALDFERIQVSLGYLAPTAKAVGLSLENTGAIIGTLVDNQIKAQRAGRLMSSSFLRLANQGITLDEALEQVNNSQDKLVTAGKLFGTESATLGLILADNTDKVEDYTKAFEDAGGSLDDLTNKQLESLDAKLKILDSTWEKFIFKIENGQGGLANVFKGAITGATTFLDRLNDINTTSDGYFSFAGGVWKSFIFGQSESIKLEAESIRNKEKQTIAATNLVNLLDEENKKIGVQVDKEKLLATFKNLTVDQINEQIAAIKGKQEAEEEAAKVETESEEERKKRNEEAKEKREAEQAQELENIKSFNEQKKQLENEIDLANKETDEEKEVLQEEQNFEKQLAELEQQQLNDEQKYELSAQMYEAHKIRLQEIEDGYEADRQAAADKAAEDALKAYEDAASKEIAVETAKQNAKFSLISTATNALMGLLGDSLGAQLAGIAVDALIEIAKLKIATSSAQQINMAQAVASAAPPFNIPFIATAATQNIALGAKSKVQQSAILTSAALSAGSSVIGSFYDGGVVDSGVEIPVSMRNSGGDDVLIQAKRGEVILNEKQQARAGGKAFFDSIGVPSHNTGGFVGSSTITNPITQSTQSTNNTAEALAEKMNSVKIVAIESEITDKQAQQVQIESRANI